MATCVQFKASAVEVWNKLMFYEEVPGVGPFLLRALLPQPLRTEGDKTSAGTAVRCIYRGGELVKRITAVEPPHLLEFDVVEQRLGIEDCIVTLGGSYQIHECGDASDVVLKTKYEAYLHPRSLWRPVEKALVSRLHRHILCGVAAAVLPGEAGRLARGAESRTLEHGPTGGLTCTVSQSGSRR